MSRRTGAAQGAGTLCGKPCQASSDRAPSSGDKLRTTHQRPPNRSGAAGVVRGAVLGHGPVVKLQLVVPMGLPPASRMAAAPPVRVAVKRVFAARVAFGFRVATRVVAL
jgi:hypothetical protein